MFVCTQNTEYRILSMHIVHHTMKQGCSLYKKILYKLVSTISKISNEQYYIICATVLANDKYLSGMYQ